jgi:hypothetical protein
MTIQQELLERLSTLPPSDQQELLRVARSLSQRAGAPAKPWKSMMGAFAGKGIDVDEADIDAARREMWRDFPRDVE